MKTIKAIFLGSLLAIGLLCLSFYIYLFQKRTYDVEINLSSGQNIRKELSKLELGKAFFLYLKYWKEGGKNIKAAYYHFQGDYSMVELVSMLEEGKGQFVKFTIIEGTTLPTILRKLEEAGFGKMERYYAVLNEKDFPYPRPQGNWEGYFYPETYNIPKGYEEEQIVDMFLQEFLKRFPVEEYSNREEFYQKLILASLLEREAQLKEEKALMASVIENRLAKGMRLEIDSTINYIFDYQKKRILYKDLEVESPYNSYRNFGLPPGPICSPTKDSVEAAYHPAQTEYYFFVTKGGGAHHFSKTYQEHMDFQKKKKAP